MRRGNGVIFLLNTVMQMLNSMSHGSPWGTMTTLKPRSGIASPRCKEKGLRRKDLERCITLGVAFRRTMSLHTCGSICQRRKIIRAR